MSKTTNKSAAFLQALSAQEPEPDPKPRAGAGKGTPRGTTKAERSASREGLKHIGGYFDRVDVEKFAVLRARLDLDNSQLIKLAVDELYRKHEAKKAFGDA